MRSFDFKNKILDYFFKGSAQPTSLFAEWPHFVYSCKICLSVFGGLWVKEILENVKKALR